MNQITTHQLAAKLLAQPDLPLLVAGWRNPGPYDMEVSVPSATPSPVAILSRKVPPPQPPSKFGYSGTCPVCGRARFTTVNDDAESHLYTGCGNERCPGRVRMERDELLDKK